MKKSPSRCLRRWQLALLCLLSLTLLPVVPARRGRTQTVTYTLTDLGTLGGAQSFAYGLNICGRVAGRSSIASSEGNLHPFIWRDGQFTDIAPNKDNGAANAVNDLGFVAGGISGERAFIWSAASGRQDIGVLPGGVASSAFDINESNLVVGVSEVDVFGRIRGFIWQQATGMQAIDTLGGSSGSANAVNNAGVVVGWAQTSAGASHAFTFSGGVLTDLATLGGASSIANGINDNGEVVGFADIETTSGRRFHGFIWSSATGMTDMGTLGADTLSAAADINSAGQAVGYSESPAGRRAFIYTRANGMSDLNALVPGSGWILQEANAINDRGQIVGVGILESNPDNQRAFLLTPSNAAPSPCSQPGSLQFDSAAYSVDESGLRRTITVTRTGGFGGTVSVNYATSNGTATAGSDYQAASGTLSFAEGETSKTFDVNVNDDTLNEADETVNLTLSNPTGGATLGAPSTAVLTITNDDTPRLQFSASAFAADESLHSKVINVTRTGDAGAPATVDYMTSDGTASQRSDYTLAFGTLRFAAGETSKSFELLLTDDAFMEGAETINLTLSNPTGGAVLGAQSTAVVTIAASDNPPPGANPIDDPGFFVRMHYHDFLGRSPDDSGLGFWTGNITSCGADAGCREVKRINVSAAFFLSIEFQNTGYLVERMYKVAYGDADGHAQVAGVPVNVPVPVIRRSEFLVDSAIIRDGVVVNVGDWEQVLESNKNAFALAFVRRQRFVDAHATSLTPAAFVQRLNQNTGNALTQTEVAALVAEFEGAADTSNVLKRASVLRKVAENAEVERRERNRAFVLMQYFGYLQRDPNAAPDTDHTGWKFWLDKLDQFGGDFQQAEMVKAFISSDEYRRRFGL